MEDSEPPHTPSPKRSPKSSPSRLPLQQRSDSDTNVSSAPSIRIVADSGPDIYSKSPFPTLPSHILSPRYASGQPDSHFDSRQGPAVSHEERSANVLHGSHSDETLLPKPLQLRKSNRASTSTTSSEVETIPTISSPFLSSSSRYSQSTTFSPPSTIESETEVNRESIEEKLPALPEEQQTPEQATRPAQSGTPEAIKSTIRLVTPSTTNGRTPLTTKQSQTSLASSTSTDTLTSSRRGERSSGSKNWSTFPRSRPPNSSEPPSSGSFRAQRASKRPVLYESTESLTSSYSSGVDRPRSASDPSSPSDQARVAAAVRFAVHSGVKVQYPVVRRSSASGSWAEISNNPTSSSTTTSKNSPSMTEGPYIPPRFTSRLSTIPSESERNSNSIDGSDQRNSLQSAQWRRRRTIGSIISTDFSSTSEGSIPIPPPLFGGNRQLPIVQGRESEEGDDTLGELQSPPLRQQRSGFFSRLRPSSSDSLRSQASQISFVGDLSWARNYYRRGENTMQPDLFNSSESRLNTATSGNTMSPTSDSFPLNIHRPRNRPREGQRASGTASSMGVQSQRTSSLAQFNPFRPGVWSPHLMRDRRSGMVYGPWAAPSFDEPFGSFLLGPVNRQVWLFCLGFVLPISWILAAILPIPKRPAPVPFADGVPSAVDIEERMGQVYLQNASVINLAEIDEKRYQKARWWRTLNRIMILPGLMIIAAVTALAVIATRMR